MNTYLIIKQLHMSCAVVTLLGFSLRGYWMLVDSALLQHKLSRVLPHIVDTALLGTAIAMVVMSQQYPFVVRWITVKLLLLLLYIVLGTFALKRGRTKQIRAACFAGALATIGAIFAIAITRPF